MGEHSKDGWAGLGELEEQGEEERLRELGKEAGEVGGKGEDPKQGQG